MIKTIIWATAISAFLALVQSTLLSRLSILHAVPDLTLGVLVYAAYNNGSMTGQLIGFSSGLVIDFLSAAPLGFNTLLRTVIGALTGIIKGAFFLDVFILPMVLCAIATILKAILAWIVSLIFAGVTPHYAINSSSLWLELLYNTLTAPIVFAFLNLFRSVLRPRKEI